MKIDTIEIARLELQPGDILLVRVPLEWSNEQLGRAQAGIAEALHRAGVKTPLLIGRNDVDFQIVRKADAA